MNSPNGNVTSVRVEIFDQAYNLRGTDPEYIFKLAEYVDMKMRAVAEQTNTVDSLRLAVLAALNIADEYHILKRKYDGIAGEINQRTHTLEGALDEVLQDSRRAG
ncbi:MAG: cell division protein ZapA [Terriglobales bacterium]